MPYHHELPFCGDLIGYSFNIRKDYIAPTPADRDADVEELTKATWANMKKSFGDKPISQECLESVREAFCFAEFEFCGVLRKEPFPYCWHNHWTFGYKRLGQIQWCPRGGHMYQNFNGWNQQFCAGTKDGIECYLVKPACGWGPPEIYETDQAECTDNMVFGSEKRTNGHCFTRKMKPDNFGESWSCLEDRLRKDDLCFSDPKEEDEPPTTTTTRTTTTRTYTFRDRKKWKVSDMSTQNRKKPNASLYEKKKSKVPKILGQAKVDMERAAQQAQQAENQDTPEEKQDSDSTDMNGGSNSIKGDGSDMEMFSQQQVVFDDQGSDETGSPFGLELQAFASMISLGVVMVMLYKLRPCKTIQQHGPTWSSLL